MTKNITSARDLRNWCDSALGENATDNDTQALFAFIRDDSSRPIYDAYDEWGDYLESLGDVWSVVYRVTTAATIRRLREQSGRTITDIARAAGISRQALQMIESGQRQPTLETAQKVLAALGKSLAELDQPA